MVQSLDIPDFENILATEATLGSEKISISQQQVFVTRLMRHRADECVPSLCLLSLLFIWLFFPLWHLLSLTWMRCQNSIPSLQHSSHLLLPLLLLQGSYSFLLFWDWQGHYFSFCKKCLSGIFKWKETTELWKRSETLLSGVFYIRKMVA